MTLTLRGKREGLSSVQNMAGGGERKERDGKRSWVWNLDQVEQSWIRTEKNKKEKGRVLHRKREGGKSGNFEKKDKNM